MDIFEKCFAPSLAGELKEKGVYPYFHALQSRQDVEVQMEGKRRIMLGWPCPTSCPCTPPLWTAAL